MQILLSFIPTAPNATSCVFTICPPEVSVFLRSSVRTGKEQGLTETRDSRTLDIVVTVVSSWAPTGNRMRGKTPETVLLPSFHFPKLTAETTHELCSLGHSRDEILERHIFMQQDQVDDPLADDI